MKKVSHAEFLELKAKAEAQKPLPKPSITPEVGKTYMTEKFDVVSVEKITDEKIVIYNHTAYCRQYIKPEHLFIKKEMEKVQPAKDPKVLPMKRSKMIWVV